MESEPQPRLTDLDRRIWGEELDAFVPERIFDVHTHVYRWQFSGEKDSGSLYDLLGNRFPVADWQRLDRCDGLLMPGRRVSRLAFGFPFPNCDFEAANRFVAGEVARDPASAGLALVHPRMAEVDFERQVRDLKLIGLKPYRCYAASGDPVECRIGDMLPDWQTALADRHGLIVMLHLARAAIADPENIADLEPPRGSASQREVDSRPLAESSAWPIERVAGRLRGLPNVWFDTSSVCESDAIERSWRRSAPIG